ncbi:MAG: hypothetical protein GF411_17100 [Candidatus Lokiarchaeota archaeon]|nr:hypothetical protein [Candidatus Lokiarchaeota archaeon]
MGYHHKRETCAKGTKEVLENILKSRKSEYEILGSTEAIQVGSPIEEIVEEEAVTNILPGETEDIIEESDQVDVESTEELNELDSLVEYKAMIPVDLPTKDAKDEYEKKQKKRNYIEFRFDYAR